MSKEKPGKPDQLCIIPNCGRKFYGRGLCGACFKKAALIMKRDNLAWDDLIDLGLATGSFVAPFIRAYTLAVRAKDSQKNTDQPTSER